MGVTFDDQDGNISRRITPASQKGPVVKLLLKMGIVKDESQAQIAMILISLTCISLTVYLIFFS